MPSKKPRKRTDSNIGENSEPTSRNTYVGGKVQIENGDFIGGDKLTVTNDRSISIGGNAAGTQMITGDASSNSSISANEFFVSIDEAIDKKPDLAEQDKRDLKEEVNELRTELGKGEAADESFLARRLRNIGRMAPDILEVVLATITNPTAGFGVIARKVSEKLK